MKTILLFGAGKSATVLIDYLKSLATSKFCNVMIADSEIDILLEKVTKTELVSIHNIDVKNDVDRLDLIKKTDVVISLLPPNLHYLVATSCIQLKKHLLTASYINDEIKNLATQIADAGVLFLYEMGLDPGIDHMSAMQLIDRIQNKAGKITVLKSHCGGLIAPESDNNCWHYKISWNPRNIVLAGKSGATYLQNKHIIHQQYELLFNNTTNINIDGLGSLSYYPNRDSLSYIEIYKLKNLETFIRTTLRQKDFCKGWQKLIEFKLTDEQPYYKTDGLTISTFLKEHLNRFRLFDSYKTISDEIIIRQLKFLFDDNKSTIDKGVCSAADVLQFIIEEKLKLQKSDIDMIVMQHEINYEIKHHQKKITSTLIVKGKDNARTAMAKTVGLPLGIAAKLILKGEITLNGLVIPTQKEIYEPVLEELKNWGIVFTEKEDEL